jgi:hypothetical protein
MLFSPQYQGNTWWVMWALFSLFLAALFLRNAWQRHKVGIPVNRAAVMGMCVWFLMFVAYAIFQVLTHQ